MFEQNHDAIDEMLISIGTMKNFLKFAPTGENNEDEFANLEILMPPLGKIRQGSHEFKELDGALNELNDIIQDFLKIQLSYELPKAHFKDRNAWRWSIFILIVIVY